MPPGCRSPTKNVGFPATTGVLNSPDNLAQDALGNIYITEDAPNSSLVGGDVWFMRDVDSDGVAESLDHFMSNQVGGSESTGMIFNPRRPTEFVLSVMHPISTDLPGGLGDALWVFDLKDIVPPPCDSRGRRFSLDGPAGELWLLARALLRDQDSALPLLPSGEARLERVGTHAFDNGLELQLVEIHGLGFEPVPLWLDDQGRLFAIVSGWLAVVLEGHEALASSLNDIQDARRNDRFRAIADSARTVPAEPVLIDNARIFDVASGTVLGANAVVVDDDTIVALLAPGDPRPQEATRVDAEGRTLLPGLWDMHTHLDLGDAPLHLAAGITTVRDLANDHEQLMGFIDAIENGDAVGPHVLRAGFIDGTGPYAGPTKARVETLEEAIEWIDFYAAEGYQQIKIYSSIPVELVPGMAQHAHELGLRFSGHIPAGMWADEAVLAGYDEIQHVNMIFLNFYRDIVETRNPDRFIKVAERGADLKTDSAPFREFTQLLLDHGTVVDPTVAVLMDLFVHEPGHLAPSLASAEVAPGQVWRRRKPCRGNYVTETF